MRRVLTITVVLAIAVVAGGCRQLVAHRARAITIGNQFTGEDGSTLTDTEWTFVSGTVQDWGDTTVDQILECARVPATAADAAADCSSGGYYPFLLTFGHGFSTEYDFLRHIYTTRSGWVDCALSACSLVVHASGPYYCDGIDGPVPSCWKDHQPGDDFEVYQPRPMTFLRTPEVAADCATFAQVVNDNGNAFTSQQACNDYVATLPAVHVSAATGLQDGQTIQVTGAKMDNSMWSQDPEVMECVGPQYNSTRTPGGCTPSVTAFDVIDQGTFTIDFTVARHIATTNGTVDCAVTPCTIAVRGGDGDYPYYYRWVSAPITFSP